MLFTWYLFTDFSVADIEQGKSTIKEFVVMNNSTK